MTADGTNVTVKELYELVDSVRSEVLKAINDLRGRNQQTVDTINSELARLSISIQRLDVELQGVKIRISNTDEVLEKHSQLEGHPGILRWKERMTGVVVGAIFAGGAGGGMVAALVNVLTN